MAGSKKKFDVLVCEERILSAIRKTIPSVDEMSEYSISYIDFSSTAGNLCYLDYSRFERMVATNANSRSLSYRSKVGRTILKLMDNAKPHEIQQIVADIVKHESENPLKIYSDVHKIYNSEKIVDAGNLGNSCMNRRRCTVFYNKFSEEYSIDKTDTKTDTKVLAMFNSEGVLLGRAILWYNIPHDGGYINFMDRIYIGNDNDTTIFIDWAKENGFWYKKRQSYDYKKTFILPNDTQYEGFLYIPIHNTSRLQKEVPYMDTFSYIRDDVLTNNGRNAQIELTGTGGYGYVADGLTCSECGCPVSDSYTHPIHDTALCECCYDVAMEDIGTCDCCDIYVYHADMLELANGHNLCESCMETQAGTCRICREGYYNDELEELGDGHHVCGNCIEDVSNCDKCNYSTIDEGNLYEVDDGRYLCKKCLIDEGESICSYCGDRFAISNHKSKSLCKDCWEKLNLTLLVKCCVCGNDIEKRRALFTNDQKMVCSECMKSNNYPTCEITGALITKGTCDFFNCNLNSCPMRRQ